MVVVVATGGDRRFYYPKYVWTPSGGWWNHTPKGYKKSFVITLLALGALSYATFTVSANNEVPCLCRSRPSSAVFDGIYDNFNIFVCFAAAAPSNPAQ